MKIDCEGAEYEINDTLPDEYFDKIDKIVIEYHFADSKPELSKKLISRLKKMQFKTYLPPHYDDMGILYAKKWNLKCRNESNNEVEQLWVNTK